MCKGFPSSPTQLRQKLAHLGSFFCGRPGLTLPSSLAYTFSPSLFIASQQYFPRLQKPCCWEDLIFPSSPWLFTVGWVSSKCTIISGSIFFFPVFFKDKVELVDVSIFIFIPLSIGVGWSTSMFKTSSSMHKKFKPAEKRTFQRLDLIRVFSSQPSTHPS